MRIDPVEEWRRLTEHYRRLTSEELEELAGSFADLTEAAQQALRAEMHSRGLSDQAASPGPGFRDGVGEAETAQPMPAQASTGYTWKTLLCECDTSRQAWQISEALRRGGVESWIEGPKMSSPYTELDVGNPRVLVAADELDLAREVLSRPIPQEIIDESMDTVAEFAAPRCPRCGAEQPILESIDPVNTWRCGCCGQPWSDPDRTQT
jgi:hypothetical protein